MAWFEVRAPTDLTRPSLADGSFLASRLGPRSPLPKERAVFKWGVGSEIAKKSAAIKRSSSHLETALSFGRGLRGPSREARNEPQARDGRVRSVGARTSNQATTYQWH